MEQKCLLVCDKDTKQIKARVVDEEVILVLLEVRSINFEEEGEMLQRQAN